MKTNLDTLEVNLRETKSKSEIKKLRLDGYVPGVLYGNIKDNINLSIKKKFFR